MRLVFLQFGFFTRLLIYFVRASISQVIPRQDNEDHECTCGKPSRNGHKLRRQNTAKRNVPSSLTFEFPIYSSHVEESLFLDFTNLFFIN